MPDIVAKRISDAIEDIERIIMLFRQRYGRESFADREISAVLKTAEKEHKELMEYRKLGTVKELGEKLLIPDRKSVV